MTDCSPRCETTESMKMNKKGIMLACLLLGTCTMVQAQQTEETKTVAIIIGNDGDLQRQQVVETEAAAVRRKLGLNEQETFVLRNAAGQQVDYQISYDGMLLFEASVQPHRKAIFRAEKGVPRAAKTWVHGAQYKIRKDDMAWENDRSAYRMYGPALQQTGERSFGIDVWTKRTPELVLDERYQTDYRGNVVEDSLRRSGNKDAARDVDLETSFHLDHGYGMDAYGVGPTLGCGAPALLDGERLILPWCYESYRILDNGPLRFTAELTYQPVSISHASPAGQTTSVVTEHRLLSLDKGSNFNRMTVWYDGLKSPLALAAGVVLHGGNPLLAKDHVLYADPTEAPDRHNSQVFVATLFHNGVDQTRVLKSDERVSHAIGIVDNYDGHPYTYYFGAAWSLYDVRSIEEWQLRATQFMQALEQPLSITLQ